ncbi:MAG TPA: transporter substrate-binding domain-containing protein, partial [Spirochaetales bacterium]|nr:transporter substrate-binding domain-containing protein [Spirochaetales bacterium]
MRLKSFLLCLIVIALFTGCTKAELSLNIDEITWLKKNNMEIVFVGQINYPPFEFISDERGDYTGMAIELIRWMGTELGFTPVFKPMTFASAQQTVLNGKADALTGIFESPQRKLLFDFTDEVFSVPASIFIHSDRTDIITVQDLAHK